VQFFTPCGGLDRRAFAVLGQLQISQFDVLRIGLGMFRQIETTVEG